MASILKQSVSLRRFKNLSARFISKEFKRTRITDRIASPLNLLQATRGRHYIRLGGIICGPFEVGSTIQRQQFKKLGGIFHCISPNGNGDDKNDKPTKQQRDEEIKKLQDLRQRGIDHIFNQESVWKAMKERDELLRRDRSDKERDKDKPDNDEHK